MKIQNTALVCFIILSSTTGLSKSGGLTKASRWEGAFIGCQTNVTDVERVKLKNRIPVVCGCIATRLVNQCVKTDSDVTEIVQTCVTKYVQRDAAKLFDECNASAKLEAVLNPYIK